MYDIKLKDLSWVVRWSIVHKYQTLIFNNIEVNCIGEIVPQTIFLRGGVRLTHLGGGAYFKGRSLNLRRESIDVRGRQFILMPVHMLCMESCVCF